MSGRRRRRTYDQIKHLIQFGLKQRRLGRNTKNRQKPFFLELMSSANMYGGAKDLYCSRHQGAIRVLMRQRVYSSLRLLTNNLQLNHDNKESVRAEVRGHSPGLHSEQQSPQTEPSETSPPPASSSSPLPPRCLCPLQGETITATL